MKVEVEQVSPVQRKLLIEVPWDSVKEELDLAYKGLQKRARVRGFRAGKVPRKVLEQYYRGAVEGEVVNRLVDEGVRKAMTENALVPIANPQLEDMPTLAPNAPLAFVATVDVKPEVEIADYKGVAVERKVRMVTDEEVERELAVLREKAVVIEQVTDRNTIEKGDLAVIDFFGFVDGETFKGGKGINYTVEVGGGQMIPGFEDQLLGLTIGEEKTFDLRFPEGEGPEEVQGKDVEWKVDLKEIKRKILPDLDDEFAKDLGDHDTLDELRSSLRDNIATREDAKSRRLVRDAVLERLVELNPVDVPPLMVDRQLDFLLQDAVKAAEQSQSDEIKQAVAKLRDEARPRAERQVAGILLLEAVARKEEIEVSDGELDGRVADLAREHRMPAPQLKKQLRDGDQLESLRYNMRQDKALEFVVDAADITERQVSAEELEAEHDHEHDHDDT